MNEPVYYRCINESCNAEYLIGSRPTFTCECDDLLDVIIPKQKGSREYWIGLYNSRRNCARYPSRAWQFAPWVDPGITEPVTLGEGNVPIVEAPARLRQWVGGNLRLYVVLEGKNPTGSFKDRGMSPLVSRAKKHGAKFVVCTSTGDTSAALAAYAAAAGIRCFVILPYGKVTEEQVLQAKLLGATIIFLKGSFDDCMRVQLELVKHYGMFPGNSIMPFRIQGHQTLIFQVVQHFGWTFPDWFVAPVGNGSNCSSLGLGLRTMRECGFDATSRILGCQSEAANPLYLSWREAGGMKATREGWEKVYKPITVGETIATAARIGKPVSWKKVIREITISNGAMAMATEAQLREAVIVAALSGLFLCPQSGQALAGLKNAVAEGIVAPKSHVVVVSTADGLKFTKPFSGNLFEGATVHECDTDEVASLIMAA